MTTLKAIAAAAALSALTATSVFAQAAIQEPGMFAFYHPNLDVLNDGAPTPASRLEAQGYTALQASQIYNSGLYQTRRYHHAR
jgi:hypothetical protein